ncbi:MAG: MOSC domain-containing protein [Solirubrobacteraceae bacterium]
MSAPGRGSPPSHARVTALSLTSVKGTRLQQVNQIELDRAGPRGDRRFFVIDARGRMINAKQSGELQEVICKVTGGPEGPAAGAEPSGIETLRMVFPAGDVVEALVVLGEPVVARFYSRELPGRLLEGPWATALSEHLGQPVRLVEGEQGAADRGRGGAVSLISTGSLAHLAAEAELSELDARRFRMLIEVDGLAAHAEDGWVGGTVCIAQTARVHFAGHVGRCLITSRDPDTGVIDLPTLELLGGYRSHVQATEPLPFGVYGQVVAPGAVRVGDLVWPVPEPVS